MSKVRVEMNTVLFDTIENVRGGGVPGATVLKFIKV